MFNKLILDFWIDNSDNKRLVHFYTSDNNFVNQKKKKKNLTKIGCDVMSDDVISYIKSIPKRDPIREKKKVSRKKHKLNKISFRCVWRCVYHAFLF